MSYLYYLAYGSNLHPHRLQRRLRSARLLGIIPLPGYRLTFHKRGQDTSGKGDLLHTGQRQDRAYAAIYRVDARQKALLDRIEGAGYRVHWLKLMLGRRRLRCFAYLAEPEAIDPALRPFPWYRELIAQGAHYHGLPAGFVGAIHAQDTQTDASTHRQGKNLHVLRRIHALNKRRRRNRNGTR